MIRVGDKIIPWARIRPWVRQPHSQRHVWDPLVALSSIETVPDRIDAVAQDINSGALAYAAVGAWELGELLGLDWEGAPAEWAYTTLRAKRPLQDGGFESPYAEPKAADAWGIGLARTELVASDGTVLHFELVVGDAGDLEDPKGPYEFERGEFLDTAEWIEID